MIHGVKTTTRGRLAGGVLFGVAAAGLLTVQPGCGGRSQVPTGDPAENIRKLALAYVQFSAQNRGVGPKNREQLKDFMIKRNGVPAEEAEQRFISPRDNQEYEIRWGLRPEGSGPLGPEPPTPPIIIHEKVGVDGVKITANGRLAILNMNESELSQALAKER